MKKITFLFLFLILGGITKNYAQDESDGTTAAPFLLIAPDARSGGLADMGVATSVDANSQFFNPAKYAFLNSEYAIGINYTPWLRNIDNDVFLGSLTFASRINERSSWAVGLRYFSLGDIELSDENGFSLGTERPNEIALDGSYSLKLSENFSMGVGLRYLRSDYALNLDDSDLKTVNSFAVDLGAYYRSNEKNHGSFNGLWRAGASISNVGPKVELSEQGGKSNIPTNIKLGGGYEFILDENTTVTTTAEYGSIIVPDFDLGHYLLSFGAEYTYSNVLALRAGYLTESGSALSDREYVTFGGGVSFSSAVFDVSYLVNTSDVTSPLENTLRFSLRFNLGDSNSQATTN